MLGSHALRVWITLRLDAERPRLLAASLPASKRLLNSNLAA